VTRRPNVEERRQQAQEVLEKQDKLPIEPISVRIATAVKLTGTSRSVLYELIGAGAIETRKIGQSTFVLYRSLKRLLDG
jgi:predicted DNA-binding transcriptional regulator AlpA